MGMRLPSGKWPRVQQFSGIPAVSRNSERVSRGNWVYLAVGTAVTLLVVWSIWGTLTLSLSRPPSTCACPILWYDRPSPVAALEVVGLFFFYVVLFYVKRYVDKANG